MMTMLPCTKEPLVFATVTPDPHDVYPEVNELGMVINAACVNWNGGVPGTGDAATPLIAAGSAVDMMVGMTV
jgi:hypothetical protein